MMRHQNKSIFLSLLLTIFFIGYNNTLGARVKLSAIFSDNMILQQKSNAMVWGWATAGESISVTGNWSTKSVKTVADASGKWKLELPTSVAGGPYILTVKGENEIQVKDVWLGEVWVCSGQSNMGFTLKSNDDAKAEIAAADYPTIRYFSVQRQYGLKEFDDCPGSVWKKTSPTTAGGFSAVAYFFARRLQAELKVPVGILFNAWGGTPAEAWTPSDVLSSDTVLSKYFDRWKAIQDNVGKDSVAYYADLANWKKDSTKRKKPAEPQSYYYFNRPWREPSVLFNGMLNPLIPYRVKGILWYQGESNVSYATEYYRLFSKMIESWRDRWTVKDLPFYFVQIAPYNYNNLNDAALLREAQDQVMRSVKHTGMVVSVDYGNMEDIHFTQKKEIGNRLAFIALKKDYQQKINDKGPDVKKAKLDKEKVIVEFNSASPIVFKGNELKGFELGYKRNGTDSIIYKPAMARIEKNKVIVWTAETEPPVELRYAWLLCGEANLFDEQGLPAFPFRRKVDK